MEEGRGGHARTPQGWQMGETGQFRLPPAAVLKHQRPQSAKEGSIPPPNRRRQVDPFLERMLAFEHPRKLTRSRTFAGRASAGFLKSLPAQGCVGPTDPAPEKVARFENHVPMTKPPSGVHRSGCMTRITSPTTAPFRRVRTLCLRDRLLDRSPSPG